MVQVQTQPSSKRLMEALRGRVLIKVARPSLQMLPVFLAGFSYKHGGIIKKRKKDLCQICMKPFKLKVNVGSC